MNKLLREFEKESKLEIFGLGAKRHIWEAALEKYAELIVQECCSITDEAERADVTVLASKFIKTRFGVE